MAANQLFARATLLDPTFKTLYFENASDTANAMQSIINEMRRNSQNLCEEVQITTAPSTSYHTSAIWKLHEEKANSAVHMDADVCSMEMKL